MDVYRATEIAYKNGYDAGKRDAYAEMNRAQPQRAKDRDGCPVCGVAIPTDDRYDFIPAANVHYCYFCGTRIDGKKNDE